jgi:hypothetical protein
MAAICTGAITPIPMIAAFFIEHPFSFFCQERQFSQVSQNRNIFLEIPTTESIFGKSGCAA